jgi:hypothetical protein
MWCSIILIACLYLLTSKIIVRAQMASKMLASGSQGLPVVVQISAKAQLIDADSPHPTSKSNLIYLMHISTWNYTDSQNLTNLQNGKKLLTQLPLVLLLILTTAFQSAIFGQVKVASVKVNNYGFWRIC